MLGKELLEVFNNSLLANKIIGAFGVHLAVILGFFLLEGIVKRLETILYCLENIVRGFLGSNFGSLLDRGIFGFIL